MGSAIDFFFEFASPYSFIASVRLAALSARTGRQVRWRPIVLEAVWRKQGLHDAYAVIRNAKRLYIRADSLRVAEDLGIALRRPTSPVRAELARLAVYALELQSPGLGGHLAERLFRLTWSEGRPLQTWSDIADALPAGTDHDRLQATLANTCVTQQLEQSNAEAARLGCFGVPWFHAESMSFFGQDRLPLLERSVSIN